MVAVGVTIERPVGIGGAHEVGGVDGLETVGVAELRGAGRVRDAPAIERGAGGGEDKERRIRLAELRDEVAVGRVRQPERRVGHPLAGEAEQDGLADRRRRQRELLDLPAVEREVGAGGVLAVARDAHERAVDHLQGRGVVEDRHDADVAGLVEGEGDGVASGQQRDRLRVGRPRRRGARIIGAGRRIGGGRDAVLAERCLQRGAVEQPPILARLEVGEARDDDVRALSGAGDGGGQERDLGQLRRRGGRVSSAAAKGERGRGDERLSDGS